MFIDRLLTGIDQVDAEREEQFDCSIEKDAGLEIVSSLKQWAARPSNRYVDTNRYAVPRLDAGKLMLVLDQCIHFVICTDIKQCFAALIQATCLSCF